MATPDFSRRFFSAVNLAALTTLERAGDNGLRACEQTSVCPFGPRSTQVEQAGLSHDNKSWYLPFCLQSIANNRLAHGLNISNDLYVSPFRDVREEENFAIQPGPDADDLSIYRLRAALPLLQWYAFLSFMPLCPDPIRQRGEGTLAVAARCQ